MRRLSGPRKTASNLSESVHQQLNRYALAASAAGVSLLASAQPAEARIVYTSANVKMTGTYNLDLNGDGITDFAITYERRAKSGCSIYAALHETALPLNGAEVDQNGALALYQGDRIGFGDYFGKGKALMAAFAVHKTIRPPFCVSRRFGDWQQADDRYLGLKFKVHGKTHYGWARFTVHIVHVGNFHFLNATLTGYAYETIPGKSIKAGQTKGMADDPTNEDFGAYLIAPIPDTPKHATLGLLALGSPGLSLWRRENSASN